MAAYERARRDIVALVHKGLGVRDFAQAAGRALERAVPFEGSCLLTLDPATLLPTGEVVEGGLPAPAMARLGEIELREPDYTKFRALARGPYAAASLSEATRGDLDQSLRQRELRRPSGFEDDVDALRAGLAARGELPKVEEVFWGFRILFLTDPFGNELQFCEPLDAEQRAAMPRWAGT